MFRHTKRNYRARTAHQTVQKAVLRALQSYRCAYDKCAKIKVLYSKYYTYKFQTVYSLSYLCVLLMLG